MSVETSTERHEIWKVLDGLQMDARAIASKIVALRAMVAQMDLPEPLEKDCPRCGIRTKGPLSLSEHVYYSHDGPTPEHWQDVESLLRDSDA
jgi:hypothetical protein